MSNLINNYSQENLTITSAIDDSFNVNDARSAGDDNSSFKCTSCNAKKLFTYCGLNQHLRACLRKEA